jgi:hypothetical protein
MRPFITVIINSYLRVDYLDEAIASVIGQTRFDDFEILLLTARNDIPAIDRILPLSRDRGVQARVVPVPPGPVGLGFAPGVRHARGEVISFLDDDDLWEPEKLRFVHDSFVRHPGLGLVHNGQTFVDEGNRALPWWNLHRLVRHPSSLIPEGNELYVEQLNPRSIRSLLRLESMFNNSSLSIRRTLLESCIDVLERLTGGEDSFLFYTALAASAPVLASSNRFTRFRVHSSASTAAGNRLAAQDQQVKNYSAYVRRHFERVSLCNEILRGQPDGPAADLLRHDLSRWALIGAAIDSPGSTHSVAKGIRGLLSTAQFGLDRRDLLAILLGVAASVSPSPARAAFMAWRRAW